MASWRGGEREKYQNFNFLAGHGFLPESFWLQKMIGH